VKLDVSVGKRSRGSFRDNQVNNPVKLDVSVANKMKSSKGMNVTRDYTMDIKLKATQAEMPGGMARLMDFLEAAITETKGGKKSQNGHSESTDDS